MLQNTKNNLPLLETSLKNEAKSSDITGNSNLSIIRKTGKWTSEEDELLKKYVPLYGEKQWRKISEHVPGRTSIQCLHRWTKILKPGLVKGPWTSEEDQKLMAWVKSEGPTKWAQAAAFIKGRSGKQCRERWFNNLNPGVKKGNWNDEEDSLIFELYKKYGSSWSKIAKMIPGRTENAIKNRFYSTLRKLTADKKKLISDIASIPEVLKQEKIEADSNGAQNTQPPNILYSLLQQGNDGSIKSTNVYANGDIKEDKNSNIVGGMPNFSNNNLAVNMEKNNHSIYNLMNNYSNTNINRINNVNPPVNSYGNGLTSNLGPNVNYMHNFPNQIKMTNQGPTENKFVFNENEESDINFERFLMTVEKNISDDMISKEFESNDRDNESIEELDKIQRSIAHYCSNNIMELGDSFKSMIPNKLEESMKQPKRTEYGDISSPLIMNGNNKIENSMTQLTHMRRNAQPLTSSIVHSGNNQIPQSAVQIQNPSFLPPLYDKQKDNETLKNGLEMAIKQNLMKTNKILTLQNNQNSSENINMIFDMISGMINDKTTNNEQRIVFLFQQLYSLESLLTNTRNELVKLESSIRNDEDDKKSKKQIHELNFEDDFGHENAYQIGLDNIQKKRHKN